MFLTIVIFVAILVVLILIHEIGHFIVAKLCGVKVQEFAFGFPPRLFSVVKNGTRYAINLIPLGGYVSLLGEDGTVKEKGSYYSAKVWQKMLIVGTGVVMNFILGIIVLAIGFTIGMTPLVSDPVTMSGQKTSQVMVVQVVPDSPAAKIALESGNILNGFASPSDLQTFTRVNAGQKVTLSVQNGSGLQNREVDLGSGDAPLGVGVVSITKVKQPFWKAIGTATIEVGKSIAMVFTVLWGIIISLFTTGNAGEAGAGVVGPIGIFNFTSQALKIGWIYILQLLAILSINLGIINILPFPALDGGKIFFLALEGIFRKKVIRLEVENLIHTIGFAVLIIFILAITFRDILRLH
ncbi:MAG: putative rane-associated zinc metalloprotease, regulator of sigma protease [Candidatus Berkelbacteria bacterium]|nr:putative rane-associated zinc metalloprotease, regulator of sigma protease [Candidatus Berkelbacteria bacterium]